MQTKEVAWYFQWSRLELDDENIPLIEEWIHPYTLDDFDGKTVLDCGCGQGQHVSVFAARAKSVVGVDLNTAEIARRRNSRLPNVEIIEADIAELALNRTFDIVTCMGVIHHTQDPDRTFRSVARCVKPGGRLLIYVYSREGNFWSRAALEPFKRLFLNRLGRGALYWAAWAGTVALGAAMHTVYRLPLPLLPFYDYFRAFRKLSFTRQHVTVFDMLNAPRTRFLRRGEVEDWFSPAEFTQVHISHLKGVCWRASATRR